MTINLLTILGAYTFDATIEEGYVSTLVASDNPIETGSTVGDHMFMGPQKYTMSAAVSATPLHSPISFGTGQDRPREAWRSLKALQGSFSLMTIFAGLDVYTNMICLEVRTSQDKDTGNILYFEADFREFLIVSTQVVSYPPRATGSTARQASAKKQNGTQQGTTVPAPKSQSLLKKFTTLFGGN